MVGACMNKQRFCLMEKSSFAPAAPQTTTNSNNLELKAAGCCLKVRTGHNAPSRSSSSWRASAVRYLTDDILASYPIL